MTSCILIAFTMSVVFRCPLNALYFKCKIINGELKTKNEINDFQELAIFKDGVTL